jgi:hypothetical protein
VAINSYVVHVAEMCGILSKELDESVRPGEYLLAFLYTFCTSEVDY